MDEVGWLKGYLVNLGQGAGDGQHAGQRASRGSCTHNYAVAARGNRAWLPRHAGADLQ